MDKIWYRYPSKLEVIDRCGGDEKNEWSHRTNKSRTLKTKTNQKKLCFPTFYKLAATEANGHISQRIYQISTLLTTE